MLGETAVGEGDRFDDGCGEQFGDSYAWISATGPRASTAPVRLPHPPPHPVGPPHRQRPLRRHRGRHLHLRPLPAPTPLHVGPRLAGQLAHSQPEGRQRPRRGALQRWPGCGNSRASRATQPSTTAPPPRLHPALHTARPAPALLRRRRRPPGSNDPDSRRDMPWTGDLADIAMTADAPSPPSSPSGPTSRPSAPPTRRATALTAGPAPPSSSRPTSTSTPATTTSRSPSSP
ncbi:MAG: hypothetical protein R3F43_28405 [bacterium]